MSGKDESLKKELETLQEEYSKTKYNKATNVHLGLLRAKIAKVKRDIVEAGKRVHGKGFFVKKQGDATVALLGFPSAGKSSLINRIANTSSKTAAYAFTTTTIIPGTMIYNGAHIQVFDMPGIIKGAHMGAGGGRSVIAAMRSADLVVFVVDINTVGDMDDLLGELNALKIFPGKVRPDYSVHEIVGGSGLRVETNRSGLPEKTVTTIFTMFGVHNAVIKLNSKMSEDELISLVSGNVQYISAIIALNKIDTRPDYRSIAASMSRRYGMEVVPISATDDKNIDSLRDAVYRNLGVMTVHLRPKGGDKDNKPMVVRKGATVGDVAAKLHTEILDELKCAYINGPSAKFRNQRVGTAHVLKDGDEITFIKEL
ncbi:MAG: 50S ribosome-binding GTPase [Candidatus Micrarchaeota archaeon]|nr:50S ribosome-binding GTPase [Candidatus Micrarchaeota archaeon]